MFAVSKLTTVFAVLAAAALGASAAPASTFDASRQPNEEIVFSPMVTAPAAGAVWEVASVQAVTWDTSNIPAEVQNTTGLILLGYIQDNSTSEHLDVGACSIPLLAFRI